MITKEMFINCMNTLEKYQNLECNIFDVTNGAVNLLEINELQDLLSAYILLLAYCTKCEYDKYTGTDVDYFIYETEFGKKSDKYFITDKDGTEWHWEDAEDLWNYLVYQNPDIEDTSGEWEEKENAANIDFTHDFFDNIISKNNGE